MIGGPPTSGTLDMVTIMVIIGAVIIAMSKVQGVAATGRLITLIIILGVPQAGLTLPLETVNGSEKSQGREKS